MVFDQRLFGMLNQNLNPIPFQGKRVRFRAAVRTADRGEAGQAQLWLRVDRKSDDGKVQIAAFDNMQNRPITSDEWDHYEIVADVADDATRLVVGMLVIGNTKAWLDDASFEIVDESVESTVMETRGGVSANAPTQPYFNHWLWLIHEIEPTRRFPHWPSVAKFFLENWSLRATNPCGVRLIQCTGIRQSGLSSKKS